MASARDNFRAAPAKVTIMDGTQAFPSFIAVHTSICDRLLQQAGVLPRRNGHVCRMLLLIAITWLPLLIFAGLAGHIRGYGVSVSFVRDPEVNCRLLIALPLLELAEVLLAVSLTVQVKELLHSGIVAKEQSVPFKQALAEVRQLHGSRLSEVILWIISFSTALLMRLAVVPDISSSWERQGSGFTLAGWWHMLISLPVLYFFLLRALWILALWAWFLYRVSRLKLLLTPTHPDHAGGLGFLGWGLASFAPVLAAFSTVVSAGFAYEIYHRKESLDSLKYHLLIYVILVTVAIHLPLLPFTIKLCYCRLFGLLEFGRLVWRYDRAFDEKWIEPAPESISEPLLGTSDVQSLADIATAYNHVDEMRLILFDTKAATVLALASIVPMLPLIGTAIPLQEIVAKLGELLI